MNMRRFHLDRTEDETGISGTGIISVGVELPSKRCILEWMEDPKSIGIYNSIEDIIAIHGHSGKTTVVWYDNPVESINAKT